MVINEQKEKKVIFPNEAFQDNESYFVGLMVTDTIDNLACTLGQRKSTQEGISTTEEEEFVQPTKRKSLRSLTSCQCCFEKDS